jgi:hypothetical protein
LGRAQTGSQNGNAGAPVVALFRLSEVILLMGTRKVAGAIKNKKCEKFLPLMETQLAEGLAEYSVYGET